MRLALVLACWGMICSSAFADIPGNRNRPRPDRPVPNEPAPKSIEANVTVRHERLPEHVRAKLILPKDLLAAVEVPDDDAPAVVGKERTVIAGVLLSCAAASLIWVGRRKHTTKVASGLLLVGAIVGTWSLATANPPPPPRLPEKSDKIVIEYTNAIAAPVTLILNTNANR